MILHIVPTLFDDAGTIRGGAERYAFELARHMAHQTPTTLFSFGTRERDEMLEGLRLRVVTGAWHVRGQSFNPVSAALLPELLKARIVHCHQQHVLTSSLTALAGRVLGRPVFVSDLGGGGWDLSAYMSTDRWYRGHLHISAYSRQVYGHEGKPWAHVILGGVDTVKFSPPDFPARDGSIVYVGRLLPHKGIDTLIRAASPDGPVEIIGTALDPHYLADLHRLAEGKQIAFRHHCSDADIVDVYRRAACVVLPSVYRTMYGVTSKVPELLGQTLLEGMACGAPAICTDVASMPEIVRDGVDGFIVPPNHPEALGAKLAWLRQHPREAAVMGAAARQRVLEHFTWPAVVQRCLDFYAAN